MDAGVGGGVWFGVLVVVEHAYEQWRIVFIAALLIRSTKLISLTCIHTGLKRIVHMVVPNLNHLLSFVEPKI